MDKLQTPPIRTPLNEGDRPTAAAKTVKEWYLHWKQTSDLVNDHEDAAVRGKAALTTVNQIPKVVAAGELGESAVSDDGTNVTIRRTIAGAVQPTLVLDSGITALSRIGRFLNIPRTDISTNLSFDGSAVMLDDTSQGGSVIVVNPGNIELYVAPAGPNPAVLTLVVTVDANGVNVTGDCNVSGVYKVDGTQVVSNRGAALTASTLGVAAAPVAYSQAYENTLATAINNLTVRVGEIQARLQAHGLIA